MSDRAKAIEAVDTIISDLMQEIGTYDIDGEALARLQSTHQYAITLRGLIQDGWPRDVEADENHEQARAELDAKYACPSCGTRPVGPGSTSCEVCGSALEQGWIHLAAVVAARLSDEPHLVECPNCHLKLADVGASHCDGCAEGT